jgi:hypothetical protein
VTLKLRTGNYAKRGKGEEDGEGKSGMGEASKTRRILHSAYLFYPDDGGSRLLTSKSWKIVDLTFATSQLQSS